MSAPSDLAREIAASIMGPPSDGYAKSDDRARAREYHANRSAEIAAIIDAALAPLRERERVLREALEQIAASDGMCLLGPDSTHTGENPPRQYEAGSNAAFNQSAEIAKRALAATGGGA